MSYDPLPDRDPKRQRDDRGIGIPRELNHSNHSTSGSGGRGGDLRDPMAPILESDEDPPALKILIQMKNDALAEKEKTGTCTLSYWRFTNPEIWQALVDFASAPDWSYEEAEQDEGKCCQEVQTLFTRMNLAMAKQERQDLWPGDEEEPHPEPCAEQWSVVFGGKWADVACSIAEQLVDLLCTAGAGGQDSRVYTVSRTPTCGDPTHIPPKNVIHLPQLNLEVDGGKEEFEQVFNRVIDDWEKEHSNGKSDRKTPIVFYFTLAKHKGNNFPFQRNIQAANSFEEALQNIVPSRLISKGIPWKVVITGTDATNPSTQKDPTLTVKGVPTSTPKYKIVPYNTVYAASKLCQFYGVAASVSKMIGKAPPPLPSDRPENDGSLAAITKQLEAFVKHSGENGLYKENPYLTDKELDAISQYWQQVAEPHLAQHIQTAKSISICYTPLHRDPWTQMCLTDRSKESPKKFMVQNIIWRLKNAISIDRAARAHL